LSVYLSVCLFICLSVYLSIYLSICLSVRPSVCLSVCLSICLSVCLPVFPSICLSVYLSIHLSIYLSVYLSIRHVSPNSFRFPLRIPALCNYFVFFFADLDFLSTHTCYTLDLSTQTSQTIVCKLSQRSGCLYCDAMCCSVL